jgi:ABC-type antimicrobial peptide transport system permease subunit
MLWFVSDASHVGSDVNKLKAAISTGFRLNDRPGISSQWFNDELERRYNHRCRVVMGIIACLLLIVGLLGMVSMLLANLRSRINEIGLYRAVGATRLWQASAVLCEAVIIGALGGAVGGAVGKGFLYMFDLLSGFVLKPTSGWMVVAVIASTVCALFAGLIPARAAMKISPAEAIRK